MIRSTACLCVAAFVALGACADVDVPPQRGISQDIDAAHQQGPTSQRPGQTERNLPAEPMPWRLDGPTTR